MGGKFKSFSNISQYFTEFKSIPTVRLLKGQKEFERFLS